MNRTTSIDVTFKVIRSPKKLPGKTVLDVITPTVSFSENDIRGKITRGDDFWIDKAFRDWREHKGIPDDEHLTPKDGIVVRRRTRL